MQLGVSINAHSCWRAYLLLIRQVQGLQFGVLVGRVDLQQVVEVGGEDERAALHQLQHGAQQMLSGVLHLALQVVKDLVEAVFEKGGAHVSRPLDAIAGETNPFSLHFLG